MNKGESTHDTIRYLEKYIGALEARIAKLELKIANLEFDPHLIAQSLRREKQLKAAELVSGWIEDDEGKKVEEVAVDLKDIEKVQFDTSWQTPVEKMFPDIASAWGQSGHKVFKLSKDNNLQLCWGDGSQVTEFLKHNLIIKDDRGKILVEFIK